MIKHLISFSGGMGSFAEAHACVIKFGKENVKLLFADTNMEDEDLYRFMAECVEFLGVEIVRIADGRDPFQVFQDVKFMGNTRIDPCSSILKRELLKKYLFENYSPDGVIVHLGIDYSESHRIEEVQHRMLPYICTSTLVEDGRIIRKDYSEQFGIRKPRLYNWGLGHNNCKGFCPKAGLGHYKLLWLADRAWYLVLESKEPWTYGVIGKKHPFLRKTINGVIRYITLREYRVEFLETDTVTVDESFEFGGCGCAI